MREEQRNPGDDSAGRPAEGRSLRDSLDQRDAALLDRERRA